MSSTPVSKYLFDKLAEEAKLSTHDHSGRSKNFINNRNLELLEYSPLDGQVMPPSVDSSPDIELQHKKLFNRDISPFAANITLLNNYCSEEESDESFIRTEKLIRGSHLKDENCVMAPLQDDLPTIDVSDVLPNTKKSVFIDCLDNFKGNGDDKIKFNNHSLTSWLYDSLDNSKDLKENASDLNGLTDNWDTIKKGVVVGLEQPIIFTSQESTETKNESCNEINADESLKFNDTIEEMDYFLKHGANHLLVESKKPVNEVIEEKKIEKSSTILYAKEVSNSPKPKTIKYGNFIKPLIEKKQPSSTKKCTPFKLPIKSNLTPKSTTFKLPIKSNLTPKSTTPFKLPIKSNLTPKSTTPKLTKHNSAPRLNYPVSKHENIMSPIRHYVKNSPTVPMVKNVSPAKNYWDRTLREPISRTSNAKKNIGKENIQLPEKAYKFPKVTKVIERPAFNRLPHNNKVSMMAESIPKVMVIKHVKREKVVEFSQSNMNVKKDEKIGCSVEDSFAHLSVDCVDISHCIGKPVVRSTTLK